MMRLNVLLLVALLVSAVYLVQTAYHSRQLFVALERERNMARQLEIEAERLTVERRAQATSLRVERVAREQLQMRVATPAVTQYVTDPLIAGAPAAALSGGTP
ncbi:cell division protein FtsL [Leptothrix cholodnii SP-6]|uniref:Cell division protein FtsL n=1 Tax=Leptothrix cholodnii (strain ATCC 51168 / LMG 8142 / SP-6) TaxID=395495 RepID=B1XY21_LEPCP|nr:cell division protein FtsL [Leptothrix cholodnii]ACB32790.1 cell division protein FtsL [Leptothrix cholodnii SP-6]